MKLSSLPCFALVAVGLLSTASAQTTEDLVPNEVPDELPNTPPQSFIPDLEQLLAQAQQNLSLTDTNATNVVSRSLHSAKRAGPPVLDLIFTRHQASVDSSGNNYVFKNIPYAEAPDRPQLRFRYPLPRLTIDRTVDDGTNTRICPQGSFGTWIGASAPLLFGAVAQCGTAGGPPPPLPPPAGPESEDCLLLDIVVPKTVWESKHRKEVPILVWIHGGGYVLGSKDGVNPRKIIEKAGEQGMIFIAINYRLGLFGFPPRRPGMLDVTSNAALYDIRLALEWTKVYSSFFGGDGSKVTVMGESAGAGIIEMQLSAFGGEDGSVPFRGAIIQSPAIKPAVDEVRYSQLYNLFRQTSASDYPQVRQMTTAQISVINTGMLIQSNFSDTLFGPNVDGFFVPKIPVDLLTGKKVDHRVSLLVAHNSHEGILFTDPSVQTDAQFRQFFANFMPNVAAAKINRLASDVYPPDFSGAQPYATQTERLSLAVEEGLFLCQAYGLNLAYNNQSRDYFFNECPGLHGQDVAYTFWNGEATDGFGLPLNQATAMKMQQWFVDLTTKGTGTGSSVGQMPTYSSTGKTVRLPGGNTVTDPAANPRCNFWLRELNA